MDRHRQEPGVSAIVRRAGLWIVMAFWGVQFAELSTVAAIEGGIYVVRRLPERLIIVAAGMVLTLAFVEISARLAPRAFRQRLIATFAAAALLCVALVAFSYGVARFGPWERGRPDVVGFVYTGFAWSWFFLSVGAAMLALTYSVEVRERGSRLLALEGAAREARLAALRYQLNPHFLFNTLNSIAGLIGQAQNAQAEEMVENLADFLRATLEIDPGGEITLRREVELQQLYLAIEQVRFPDRLRCEIAVPSSLADARVPALITQPLIENAVVHSVGRSSGMVTLRMSAAESGGAIVLAVENDAGACTLAPVEGTGTGLRNVRERLSAQFGDEQSVEVTRPAAGGYRVELRLPLRRTP